MKKKSKLKKFFISIAIILVVVIVVPFFVLIFGGINCDWFTEEQHEKRISRRIDRKIKSGYYDATGYELYPLYNLDEELRYFLVEFEPVGHMYVSIGHGHLLDVFGSTSMYHEPTGRIVEKWNPCTIEETGNTKSVIFDHDENGRMITCRQSPFKYRDKLNERKYLLFFFDAGYVPAVRKGDKFVNLCANYEFEQTNGYLTSEEDELFMTANTENINFINKRPFVL